MDASGRVVDVHALRHTFGTMPCASGSDLKATQALMRHASPMLTFGVYVHQDGRRMREAFGNLPSPPATPVSDAKKVCGNGSGRPGSGVRAMAG